ncbi:putative late blight resistance protein homolog R1A-3 [Coffea arabica]|uniref:Late blight resistance protein homolog R1A-3 n=1 Tax=Coffea arabica TaxID=13443 RepID=A0A6P6V8X5_COFAR|nr:putative late blight resistance protein homolog R1B-8 [Coffea arabica]
MDEAHTVVEFLLEDLELMLEKASSPCSMPVKENQVMISLFENLKIIKSFLERTRESPFDQRQLHFFLVTEIREVLLKILQSVDPYEINALTKNGGISGMETGSLFKSYPELALQAKQIELFKNVILEIPHDALRSSMESNEVAEVSGEVSSITKSSSSIQLEEDKMVGFDDEAITLLDRLTGDQKQLEVISLVGMAGIGKTTLAKRLYNDPRVVYHFHVRGWACLAEGQKVKNVLYNLLSSVILDNASLHKMTNQEMGDKLYEYLKGKRYFIVLDAIWGSFIWNSWLKQYLPDDNTGSKILVTCRMQNVVIEISAPVSIHNLQFLGQIESWNLFVSKVFAHNESCPRELMELGSEIVGRSKGLPLAIVVLAGVAKKDKTPEWWTYIVQNIGSCIHGEEGQFIDILASSYEHLPNHLKSCFLHIASFPQNYEIPVKLVWSWIAEGFIKDTREEKLEDVAEDYLRDLVDRSLVVVSKRRSNGGIKTCYIHDLLRYLCFKKGKDSKLLWPICRYRQLSLFSPSHPTLYNYFFACAAENKLIHCRKKQEPTSGCFHSYSFHHVQSNHVNITHLSIYLDEQKSLVYKLLRVLDLEYIILENFPMEILQLVHLKYLALRIFCLRYLSLLSNFWNLETFILCTEKASVTLQQDIWKLVKLRHLHISSELEFEDAGLSSSSPLMLYNLQTISQVCPSGGSFQNILARMPNLIRMGLHLTLSNNAKNFEFPDLSSLNSLKRLKFEYQTLGVIKFCLPQPSKFPPNLKKLTLVGSHLDWKEMSVIAMLPNLEILKIKDNFFSGPLWEGSDKEFCHLKFLKLSHINLQQWIASSSSFPCLEQLVLNGCLDLEEIPSSFRENCTLDRIEVYRSSQSALDSARQIRESQKYMGNDKLKVIIHPYFKEN